MKQYELNRKEYQKIRKMDHEQMRRYCSSIFTNGYETGVRASKALSEADIRRVVLGVKGIGEKKAEDIAQVLKMAQKERGET